LLDLQLFVVYTNEKGGLDVDPKNLRMLIDHTGKTQKVIACELGITQQRLNNYVNGLREPDSKMLELLADYFNVTIDYLVGRGDHKKQKPEPDDAAQKNQEELNAKKQALYERILRYDQQTIEAMLTIADRISAAQREHP
jgi:transcriptional regulator with XRE-family HTH domain